MKTAICISGIGRSLKYVFYNLVNNLIDCWDDRDVYYILGDGEYADEVSALFSDVPNCTLVVSDQSDLDIKGINFINLDLQKETKPTPQSISKFMNKRVLLGDLLTSSGKKYERVIVSRDDIRYSKPVSGSVENLDMSKLWIPNWGHYCDGYNDRFLVSNQKNTEKYLKAWEHAREVNGFHVESFYRYYLDKYVGVEKMKTFSIELTRVRPNGDVVGESWTSAPRHL